MPVLRVIILQGSPKHHSHSITFLKRFPLHKIRW